MISVDLDLRALVDFLLATQGINAECVSPKVTEMHNFFLFIVQQIFVVHTKRRVKWQSRESGRTIVSISQHLYIMYP